MVIPLLTMVSHNHFRLVTLGRLVLLTPAGEEDEMLGKQRRRLALLAVLALRKRALPREALAEMFWGDQDEARARHSLDNALSHIRRTLGGEALARRQTDVALAAEAPLDVDAAELAEAVTAGDYPRAVALYGGPFLDGVHIEGSARFEHWAQGERQRLEALFLEACQKECHALARARRWDECAALAARWLDAAPLSADAALYRLNALKAPGTREADLATLAEYERIRARLEREYELVPDKSVAALAADIAKRLEDRAPVAVTTTVASGAPAPRDEAADTQPATPVAIPSPAAAGTAPAASPAVAPAAPIDRDVGTTSAPAEPDRGAASPARARRRWLVPALATALLAALGAFALVVRDREGTSRGSLVAAGVLGPRERILIADFQSRGPDSLLGLVVTQAIRIDLTQSRAIKVVPPGTVREVLARMKRPVTTPLDAPAAREVAMREGIKAFVTGDVASVGSGYVLSAQLVSAETGEVLAAGRETADDSTQIIRAVDRLSKRLRERIGESVRSIRATPELSRVTTSSLEALRKYSLASRAWNVEGDRDKAATLYEAAIALDSTFAAAHQGLGAMWISQAARRAGAVEALTKTFQYRHQLTERERLLAEAGYYLRVTSEFERAAAAYRALLAIIPDDQTALNNLGIAYSEMRDFARAEQTYRRAIELDSSDYFFKYTNVFHYQVIFGRLDEAETTLARAMAKFPGNKPLEVTAVGLVAARGDYAGAEAVLRKVRGASLQTSDWTLLASLALLRGKLADAERYLAEDIAGYAERGAPQTAVELASLSGFLDVWFRGAPKRGIQNVEAALAKHPLAKMHPLDRPYLPLATFFALAGEPARARALVAEFEAIDPVLRRREEPNRHAALGAIALAEGRRDDAITEFRLADRGQCPACVLHDLGRAYEAAGVADSAIAVYERYARHRMTTIMSYPYYFRYEASRAGIYKRLGELYEERGDRAKAAEYYGRFLAMWKDADPELRPAVAEVERRLARLRERG